jgi:hypothetical protein
MESNVFSLSSVVSQFNGICTRHNLYVHVQRYHDNCCCYCIQEARQNSCLHSIILTTHVAALKFHDAVSTFHSFQVVTDFLVVVLTAIVEPFPAFISNIRNICDQHFMGNSSETFTMPFTYCFVLALLGQ